ncbi:MAG: nucleoside-diphosphate kinase [Actinobacteria bacterium ATB1]|nr:nucleoside-diphosphate kinase [Actinobacteria bacterium ATB1]
MVSERTLVLVKPDGVARGLIGEVVSRIERKGYRIAAMEMRTIDTSVAETHYAEHDGKPFFGELVEFITSGPLVAMLVEGPDAVRGVRNLMGVTNPIEAAPGSLRGDFCTLVGENLVHGSDSAESAAREAALFFPNL